MKHFTDPAFTSIVHVSKAKDSPQSGANGPYGNIMGTQRHLPEWKQNLKHVAHCTVGTHSNNFPARVPLVVLQ